MKSSTKCRLITIFVHKSYSRKRQSYLVSIHLARATKRVPDPRGHCKSRTMRAVPLFFAILSTATGFKIETKKPTLVKLTKATSATPHGPDVLLAAAHLVDHLGSAARMTNHVLPHLLTVPLRPREIEPDQARQDQPVWP